VSDWASWTADYLDPLDFQVKVLDWLEVLGVEAPFHQGIRRVRITAEGDGHVVYDRIVQPMRFHNDEIEEETVMVPLTVLPPPRPTNKIGSIR
jgi:hypothetical protein